MASFASTNFLGCITYGCYVVLFLQSLFVLKRRKQGNRRIQIFLLTALFCLSTATLAVTLASNRPPKAYNNQLNPWALIVRLSLLSFANFIAESILLWRCFVVWGKRRTVIALPMILCLANYALALFVICRFRGGWQFSQTESVIDYDPSVLDYDFSEDFMLANYITCGLYFGTAFTNMLLTIMIAGRLVLFSRQIRAILGPKHGDLYTLIVAVTIESGLLYPVILTVYAGCMIAFRAVGYNGWLLTMGDVIQEAIIHVLGISQTLIIVRIALGLSVSSVDEAVSTLRMNSSRSTVATSDPAPNISARSRYIARRHSFDSLRSTVF